MDFTPRGTTSIGRPKLRWKDERNGSKGQKLDSNDDDCDDDDADDKYHHPTYAQDF